MRSFPKMPNCSFIRVLLKLHWYRPISSRELAPIRGTVCGLCLSVVWPSCERLQEHAAVPKHTLHYDPMSLHVCCRDYKLRGEKHLFVSLGMDRAEKQASCRKTRAFNSEGKAMWPFYKVCLRMRVLGESRAT